MLHTRSTKVDEWLSRARAPLDEDWGALQAELWGDPRDRDTLRERLLDLARRLRERLVETSDLPSEWEALGIDVREAAIRGRGICSTGGGRRVVRVNRDDPRPLQRFTVGHELGHLLLTSPDLRPSPISPRDEEQICEEFSAALLIDEDVLDIRLDSIGYPPEAEDVLRLCGQFRVNVRPMLFAVGKRLLDSPHCFLMARRQGHPLRPHEVAFRVIAARGRRHIYFPPNQRLTSLGLRQLAGAAEQAPHGASLEGFDPTVRIGLRGLDRARSSDTVVAPVAWRGVRRGLDAPFLLARLDFGEALDGLNQLPR
jgi:hypothetical protein